LVEAEEVAVTELIQPARPLAALLSHRLNPFVTVWFMLYGAVTVASEALRMDLSRLPVPARMVVNLAYLIGCYKLVSPLLP
jgi:hypothetical protein